MGIWRSGLDIHWINPPFVLYECQGSKIDQRFKKSNGDLKGILRKTDFLNLLFVLFFGDATLALL
jgi:hypothetical protein